MLTKDQLLDTMRHETNVIKHLRGKVPADQMDWRPSENQRTTAELLRYLPQCASVPAYFLVRNEWPDQEEMEKESEAIDVENGFDEAMDRQMSQLEDMIGSLDESDFQRDTKQPWGTPVKLGQGLIDMPLKCLTAYRMQLFLYAKASGASDIDTANCWIGMDRPKDD